MLKKSTLLTLCLLSPNLLAAEGGYSNYIPGTYGDFAAAMAPATPFTVRNDVYFYDAKISETVRGGNVEIDSQLSMLINLTTFIYKPDIEVFGAKYGVGFVAPLISTTLDTSINDLQSKSDVSGMGDLTLVPAALFWNVDNFHFSLAEYIVTPSASYSTEEALNPSLNYWTFDTNVAATYLNFETGQDYSINLGYSINTENSATQYKTGNELHIDYMFNQFLSETWAVGLQGFYLKQMSSDSGEGALLGGIKGRAAGFGPAVMYSSVIGKQPVSFIAKWLHEYKAENRIEGDHIYLSFALGF